LTSFPPQPLYLNRKSPWCTLDRRLKASLDPEEEKNPLPLLGINPQFLHHPTHSQGVLSPKSEPLGWKQSQTNLRYFLCICPERLRKITVNIIQYSWYPGRYLNPGPLRYIAGAIIM
jgi:hypothetical protein